MWAGSPWPSSPAITALAEGNEVVIVVRGNFIRKAVLVAVRAVKATGCRYQVQIDEDTLPTDDQKAFDSQNRDTSDENA